jgi:hypothetical protein
LGIVEKSCHEVLLFCTALSQWENQDYVEKTFIERPVYRITVLQLDIVRKADIGYVGLEIADILFLVHNGAPFGQW